MYSLYLFGLLVYYGMQGIQPHLLAKIFLGKIN